MEYIYIYWNVFMEYIYIYWNSHGTLPSANQTSAGKSLKLDFDEFPL